MKTYSSRHHEIPDHSPTLILPCSGPSPWTNKSSLRTALVSLPDPFPPPLLITYLAFICLLPSTLPLLLLSPAPIVFHHFSLFTCLAQGLYPSPLQSSFVGSKPFLPLRCRALPGLCFILSTVYRHQHLMFTFLPALTSPILFSGVLGLLCTASSLLLRSFIALTSISF